MVDVGCLHDVVAALLGLALQWVHHCVVEPAPMPVLPVPALLLVHLLVVPHGERHCVALAQVQVVVLNTTACLVRIFVQPAVAASASRPGQQPSFAQASRKSRSNILKSYK